MNLAQLFALISSLDPGSGFGGGLQPRGFSAPLGPPPRMFNPNARLDGSQVQDRRGQYNPVHTDPYAVGALIDWMSRPKPPRTLSNHASTRLTPF